MLRQLSVFLSSVEHFLTSHYATVAHPCRIVTCGVDLIALMRVENEFVKDAVPFVEAKESVTPRHIFVVPCIIAPFCSLDMRIKQCEFTEC